ncbi:hypothetical protein HZY91_07375 [Facklamia sp. DSM 111018]|uniref:Uncharacterized protein n=1 Tax=Facklamia lactis TaxID=2749967 RepID=A0ABS0LTC6_9LACT|nr:hypothetical protein [Facklamia lactis]MBG9980922.1 hypothetical protein [Facklamia lactis]MBG9986715.1 hypothetical protein [Facklamia lactis]
MKRIKKIIYLFWVLLCFISPHKVMASEETNVDETVQDKRLTEKKVALVDLPSQTEWVKIEVDEQIQAIVQSVYSYKQNGKKINQQDIGTLLESYEHHKKSLEEGINRETYVLTNNEEKAELRLVYSEKESTYLEAMGEIELQKKQTKPIEKDLFEQLGQQLCGEYAKHQWLQFESVSRLFGSPIKVSYVFDLTIYHYKGKSQEEEYAVTVVDEMVTALNFTKNDKELMKKPISLEKKQLDRLSHEAGLNKNEIIGQLGTPMSINYDSKNGIVTYGWFSQAEESVEEVYYYYAYNGVSIGLAYD